MPSNSTSGRKNPANSRSTFGISVLLLSMKTTFGFSRRGPDRVTEELAAALLDEKWVEFKALFTVVYGNLRARNAASGGEEMLRLRTYEKLQTLVQSGIVKKNAKLYRGVSASLKTFIEQLNALPEANHQAAAAAANARAAAAVAEEKKPVAKAKPRPAKKTTATASAPARSKAKPKTRTSKARTSQKSTTTTKTRARKRA